MAVDRRGNVGGGGAGRGGGGGALGGLWGRAEDGVRACPPSPSARRGHARRRGGQGPLPWIPRRRESWRAPRAGSFPIRVQRLVQRRCRWTRAWAGPPSRTLAVRRGPLQPGRVGQEPAPSARGGKGPVPIPRRQKGLGAEGARVTAGPDRGTHRRGGTAVFPPKSPGGVLPHFSSYPAGQLDLSSPGRTALLQRRAGTVSASGRRSSLSLERRSGPWGVSEAHGQGVCAGLLGGKNTFWAESP